MNYFAFFCALLSRYHSPYHAKAIDARPGNNEQYLDLTPTATTIRAVEPYVHGIATNLLPARLKQIGFHQSRGKSLLNRPGCCRGSIL